MQTTPKNSTNSPLLLAFELGGSRWKLAFQVELAGRVRFRNLDTANAVDLFPLVLSEIQAAKARFGLPPSAPVKSVYEAGRDGFWLHRALLAHGVENVIVEPASLKVDRRLRRVKSDRLDAEDMLNHLHRHLRGEKVWRLVRVPPVETEDYRRLPRQRERLAKESTQHVNRLKGLLVLHGLRKLPCSVKTKRFGKVLHELKTFGGGPLPPYALEELREEYERLQLVLRQIKRIEDEMSRLMAEKESRHPVVEKAQRLTELRGIGLKTAYVLSAEFYAWREFCNRKQVGSLAGLTDTHWLSDNISRQQGISKAGNRRVRRIAVEMAWNWLRWQPESDLSKWFREHVGKGKRKRLKRVAIVALARKLLVQLWHYLEHGVVPGGAVFKPTDEPKKSAA